MEHLNVSTTSVATITTTTTTTTTQNQNYDEKKVLYISINLMQLYEVKKLKSIKRGIEWLLTENVTKTSYSDRQVRSKFNKTN